VRIIATGICHADIDLCDDWDGEVEPVVLGHQGAGVVFPVVTRAHSPNNEKGVSRCHLLTPVLTWCRSGDSNPDRRTPTRP
jgi:D-arabinose 1-dehydrogenase-like Zn-dependent alcohol dehydrogenase